MSGKTTGWVFDHSPYTDRTFAVHLAIADSVDDMHGYEFWMTQSRLAAKCRSSEDSVRRAVRRMLDDGYLELIAEATKRQAARYRFLMPEVAPCDLRGRNEPEPEVAPCDLRGRNEPEPEVATTGSHVLTNTSERRENSPSAEPPKTGRPRNAMFDAIAAACGMVEPFARSEAGRIAAAMKEFNDIGLTPEAVRALGDAHRRTWPGLSVTPQSLVKNRQVIAPVATAMQTQRERRPYDRPIEPPSDEPAAPMPAELRALIPRREETG